ncbi:S8 family serine peptidase [Tardiphaga sp. 813_E8_N1_3]|uniref:S8 family serine peptidase n=1 Tax=Tardiphaga sp. 813_E8_N1_3 TaxID=3240760 RepID=UPI003F280533
MKCTAAVLSLAVAWPFGLSVAGAQSMMRSPSLNIGSRVPTISPSTTPRINPNIAAGAGRIAGRGPSIASRGPIAGRVGITGVGPRGAAVGTTASRTPPISSRPGRTPPPKIVGVLPTIPYVRYSPNTYPSCAYANRAASGECNEKPFVADLGGGPTPRSQNAGGGPRSNGPQAALNTRYVPRQIVAELDGTLTPDQTDALARRLRLERLSSQDFPLIGTTINLFRITDNRSVETVESQMRAEIDVRAVQPNFRYVLQDQVTTPAPAEGDPAQYAVAKLRLPEAHKLSAGANVTVAVIDSGIDVAHPELADAIVGSFDALGSKEGAHVHGTGIAGAIVSHARLMGSAPRARILAIRAFGVSQGGAESSSFIILKGINHAALNGAQVINMSFAGPQDPLIERGIAASASKGIVMVAASGNAGPKSPPLYPAANPNVIAVSATDAYDRLFTASNRGSHIAVAAPGVDIFLPAPDNKYQMTSGTSFSAAYISGLAALMIERNSQLRPNEIRSILMTTARDLGAPGRDDLFGAGAADAYSAVSAVQGAQQPMATAPAPVTPVVVTAPAPATRAVEASSPSMASDVQK